MKNICDNEEEHKARVEAVKAAMPRSEERRVGKECRL